MNLLFSKKQNEFFLDQKELYNEETKIWNIFNIIIPTIIILIPTLLISFLPSDRVNFQNLILNGSFSLLGINILFGMSTTLVNSKKLKDQKIENQIVELRKRLIIYLCILLILGTIVYILQIAFNINSNGQYITVTLGSAIMLVFSIFIGKRINLIKDELVGKSFKDDVSGNVKDLIKDLKSSVDDLE